MYIYHALINALSAHVIHINLSMIFYTHVEHSPTENNLHKVLYEKTNTEGHTLHARTHARARDCSRNWVLILVGMKIL